jgi:hypothetical protein
VTSPKIRADQLQPGDAIDLYGDDYADPSCDPGRAYEFEYVEVWEVTRETPACLVIHHSAGAFACPPDHEIRINPD